MTTANIHNHLMTPAEAADYLRVAERTLSVWRSSGRHDLPFVRVGRRVLYRRCDLDAWIDSRTGTSTGQFDDARS